MSGLPAVYTLPTALEVNGTEYAIRSDYRAILRILTAQNDPDLPTEGKAEVMLRILYKDWKDIPEEDLGKAIEKAVWFIDCGQGSDSQKKKRPRLMDWEQDAMMIITAINAETRMEVRSVPYMHWWTFFGYYMSIGESLFSTVVSIRSKKARGKKLEKYELDFLKENRDLVTLKERKSQEEEEQIRREKEAVLAFLDGGG